MPETASLLLSSQTGLLTSEVSFFRFTALVFHLISCSDHQAEEKTLWVQAKRGVLAILRVQPAKDLVESLLRPVTDDDEIIWEEILEAEMETEQQKHPRRQPSQAAADSAYRLEDIRS